ncbi:zinc finger, CCHC-type containing protein, partial [Tanacetum coccineum]
SDESQKDDHLNDVLSETPEPRKGKRARKAKSYGFDFQLNLVEGSRDQIGLQYSYCYSIEEDPRTYNEAMQSRDFAYWKEAIDDEFGSIMENNTWVLSDLPPGCKPLGCKWIFKRKMKVDGTIDKFKARLVIQGFRQKERIDYFDTYSPVARITTIRLLLALAAIHNLVIHQMDVKTAFLNGDLEEELYLVEGSRDQVGSQYSYCYSIEEDPRTYNEAMQSRDFAYWKEAIDDEFGSIMENNIWVLSDLPPGCKPLRCQMDLQRKMKSMEQCQTAIHNLGDPSNGLSKQHIKNGYLEEEVYMKHQKYLYYAGNVISKFDSSGKGVIICLYVDDMLIFGTYQNQVDKTKKFLSSRFSMKDMGEADVILDCSPVSTPMDPVEKLKPNTGKLVDQLEYSRAIGCLMYAMTSTRPDIAYAVGTMNYGLSYVGYPSVSEAYSDASWINHVEDSFSTSGWVFLLGGGAISWASKKQTCITGSTIESEFVALAAADCSPVSTPIDPVEKLMPDTGKPMDQLEYSRAIVGRLSRFTSNPSRQHWHAITRVFKYLKGTMNYGLSYVGYPSVLEAYSDLCKNKRTTYVNMKFCRFKKLGLGFLYVH